MIEYGEYSIEYSKRGEKYSVLFYTLNGEEMKCIINPPKTKEEMKTKIHKHLEDGKA